MARRRRTFEQDGEGVGAQGERVAGVDDIGRAVSRAARAPDQSVAGTAKAGAAQVVEEVGEQASEAITAEARLRPPGSSARRRRGRWHAPGRAGGGGFVAAGRRGRRHEVRPPGGAKKSREYATRNINCYPRTTGP
jgi:hypothetical protein